MLAAIIILFISIVPKHKTTSLSAAPLKKQPSIQMLEVNLTLLDPREMVWRSPTRHCHEGVLGPFSLTCWLEDLLCIFLFLILSLSCGRVSGRGEWVRSLFFLRQKEEKWCWALNVNYFYAHAGCVTLDTQPPKPSEPLIPHLQNGCIDSTFPIGWWCWLSQKCIQSTLLSA